MRIYNPGNVDTDAPAIAVKVTNYQRGELENRLVVSAETEDILDWGYLDLDKSILYIVDEPEAREWAIEARHSDIKTMLDIHYASDASASQRRSIANLVERVQQAVAEHDRNKNG